MTLHRAASTLMLILVAALAAAPQRAAGQAAPADNPAKADTPPPTLQIDVQPGPNPWTHLRLRDDPNEFHFAVVSDNAGAMRPGRFARAVTTLNYLQPRFVLSVGDFINGYRPTAEEINAMWDHFIPQALQLEPPFFYVPGNHDTASPIMRPIWHERFGRSYYHFRYRDVLFLCLDSMDGPKNSRGLSPAQVDYFRNVLATQPAPRWTFIMVHRPLWHEKGQLRWDEFEALLGDRPYTVFSGHLHQYIKEIRNGREYYTLSVTGGGNLLRGPAYGDFDHVAWVTMTAQGPRIANIEIDGVHDNDVRTGVTKTIAWSVDRAATFAPLRSRDPVLSTASLTLRLRNGADLPVRLRGTIQPHPAFSISPRVVDVRFDARQKPAADAELLDNKPITDQQITVALHSDRPVPIDGLRPLVFEGQAIYTLPDGKESIWPIRSELVFDRLHPLAAAEKAVTIDGRLEEWPDLPLALARPMEIAGPAGQWDGEADASARFIAAADERFLYIAARITDDQVIAGAERGDGVELWLDARPDHQRLGGPGSFKDLFKTHQRLTIRCGEDGTGILADADRLPAGTTAALTRHADGYSVEMAIPAAYLREAQRSGEADWRQVRLNLAVLDADPDDRQPLQLWWQPSWRSDANFPGSGTFSRGDAE